MIRPLWPDGIRSAGCLQLLVLTDEGSKSCLEEIERGPRVTAPEPAEVPATVLEMKNQEKTRQVWVVASGCVSGVGAAVEAIEEEATRLGQVGFAGGSRAATRASTQCTLIGKGRNASAEAGQSAGTACSPGLSLVTALRLDTTIIDARRRRRGGQVEWPADSVRC